LDSSLTLLQFFWCFRTFSLDKSTTSDFDFNSRPLSYSSETIQPPNFLLISPLILPTHSYTSLVVFPSFSYSSSLLSTTSKSFNTHSFILLLTSLLTTTTSFHFCTFAISLQTFYTSSFIASTHSIIPVTTSKSFTLSPTFHSLF